MYLLLCNSIVDKNAKHNTDVKKLQQASFFNLLLTAGYFSGLLNIDDNDECRGKKSVGNMYPLGQKNMVSAIHMYNSLSVQTSIRYAPKSTETNPTISRFVNFYRCG